LYLGVKGGGTVEGKEKRGEKGERVYHMHRFAYAPSRLSAVFGEV
jgi:hypothetical protein